MRWTQVCFTGIGGERMDVGVALRRSASLLLLTVVLTSCAQAAPDVTEPPGHTRVGNDGRATGGGAAGPGAASRPTGAARPAAPAVQLPAGAVPAALAGSWTGGPGD